MTESAYIFTNTQFKSELSRLQVLEKVCDPASHRRILATGITSGWQCLEIGAGAGSMMRWMAETVGTTGKVTAVDLNTRFIKDNDLSNVEVIEADINQVTLPGVFDLIHMRHVLIHLKDQAILTKLLKLLKPQGWLVIEEPDFSATRFISGTPLQQQSVEKVHQAICQMFTNQGKDYALGIKLPSILQQLELQQIQVENDVSIAAGNSDIARLMKLSAQQLAEKYIATGKATLTDIQIYCQFAEDRTAWGIYLATVGVMGQKLVDLGINKATIHKLSKPHS
ncbi:SAM-dependent methyltransferase [Pleurocapsa sp. CCALA 161]|uniref:class I SAM-dependent methyltransferase n=1 Tax=Pleurocapsa sp. CCALA 161 TaxID=2107688 RepID=UPI000D083F8D|nr:class I SAM-dependent methyltransferase [Pleurocapsa sp. CCALA 161]PSB11362.1 SAM-dependent methyltransferase [Pleurocapsa sp. CCALA 161]